MEVKEESEKSWLKAQHSENEDHGIWSHHFMWNGSLQMVTAAMKLKDAYFLEGKL